MITLDVVDDGVPVASRFSDEKYRRITLAFDDRFPDVDGTIGLSYVDDAEIRRLNRLYRQKDAVTDVLSFASASDVGVQTGMLGDVVISFDQAVRQAEEGDIELEIADLIIHGMLHVLGYDHEVAEDAAIMFPIQDSLVAKIL